MTDIGISILTLLAKGVFVFISALCIAATIKDVMAKKGWRSARPVIIWLAWVLVTWLGALLIFVLANAHTHVSEAFMAIIIIALGYLILVTALIVYLLKRLRDGDSQAAG
jgi:ABC-type branched-subunit amino acid transport system permease subunit